jgi:mannosyltransferase OCH1-like enzyme
MWLSDNNQKMPDKYLTNLETFKKLNPDWDIFFWDNNKIDQLLLSHFSNYREKFWKLKRVIIKCDVARFMVLYFYGGIYIDLDFYCIKPLNELLEFDILIFREIPEHEYRGGQLLNGFVGMTPFRKDCLEWINRMFDNLNSESSATDIFVMDTTGPRAMYEFFKDYDYLTGCAVTPFTNKKKISSTCQIDDLTYAYTNWDEGTGWNKKKNNNFSTILLISTIIFIFVSIIFIFIFKYN